MKKDLLWELSNSKNGYLFTSDVVKAGISKTYLSTFVKENNYEKVAHGIYIAPDVFPDELYILQSTNPKAIFTGETALYLNNMIDTEYTMIEVYMPRGMSLSHLKNKGISVKTLSLELYEMGKTTVISLSGNTVTTYDRERCFCETIKNRKKMEVQLFQSAIKDYMTGKGKNLPVLAEYATKLNIRDEVMKYVEVFL